jgi:hypothetical protein
MAELDITAADLARKAELSPATITGMLKGKTTPQRTTLRKLSGGLGWPHEHLWRVATGSTSQTPPGPHPLSALLSGPGFKDGAKLQSDLNALARHVARELTDGLTEPERIAAARFVTEVGVKMTSARLTAATRDCP